MKKTGNYFLDGEPNQDLARREAQKKEEALTKVLKDIRYAIKDTTRRGIGQAISSGLIPEEDGNRYLSDFLEDWSDPPSPEANEGNHFLPTSNPNSTK